jgi:hypothetical protein
MYVPSNATPAGYTKQSRHSQILQTEREIFSRGLFKGFKNCLDIQSTLHQLQISSAQGCMLRYSRMDET